MPKKINFSLRYDQDLDRYLGKNHPEVLDYKIINKALDARNSNKGRVPKFNYQLLVIEKDEQFESLEEDFIARKLDFTPIIVGAGPAGLFCALRLMEYGVKSIIFERGDSSHNRMKKIAKHWRYGEFDKDSNVCFGEGGAGLFSDGKLITRVKSPFIKYVMNKMVEFGAPEEIAYRSNPHLGSNKIRNLIQKINKYLTERGSEIYTNAKVSELLYKDGEVTGVCLDNNKKFFSRSVILATGHSADDIYEYLHNHNVQMKQKDFSVGVRVEHPRKLINKLQYGSFSHDNILETARYRLSFHDKLSSKSCYSFCMCPGGYVLSSGTDADGIVVNGMSNYSRNSPWSNSAFVVTVHAGEDFGRDHLLNGLYFQRSIEKKAFEMSNTYAKGREVPAQKLKDFIEDIPSDIKMANSCPSGIFNAELLEIFPKFITNHLKHGFEDFNKSLPGFISDDALLLAPETRTSSPVTIVRDKNTLESPTWKNFYPCGEGAGHAGGITSAAVDGVKVAEKIIEKWS